MNGLEGDAEEKKGPYSKYIQVYHSFNFFSLFTQQKYKITGNEYMGNCVLITSFYIKPSSSYLKSEINFLWSNYIKSWCSCYTVVSYQTAHKTNSKQQVTVSKQKKQNIWCTGGFNGTQVVYEF